MCQSTGYTVCLDKTIIPYCFNQAIGRNDRRDCMKKFGMSALAVLIALCCTPVRSFAEDSDFYLDYFVDRYRDDPFTVESEMFSYSTSSYGIKLVLNEAALVPDEENPSWIWMITGIGRNEEGDIIQIAVCSINEPQLGRFFMDLGPKGKTAGLTADEYESLQIGDLFKPGKTSIEESMPGWCTPITAITLLGHGTDLLGKDFEKVIRHEYLGEAVGSRYDNVKMDPLTSTIIGDVNEDESVNIIDVIKTNKYIMGMSKFNSYARFVSDMNLDGDVDSNDSLRVLKLVVK